MGFNVLIFQGYKRVDVLLTLFKNKKGYPVSTPYWFFIALITYFFIS